MYQETQQSQLRCGSSAMRRPWSESAPARTNARNGRRAGGAVTATLFLRLPRPPCCGKLLLLARWRRIVVAQLHGIGALAAGEGLEARLILGDLRERHQRLQRRALPRERVAARDARPLGGEVPGDVADGARGSGDLHTHDRLEHDRRRLLQRIEERLAPRGDEGDLLGVDRVMLAVVDGDPHILDRKAGERALGQNLPDALLDGRNVLPRDRAPDHVVDELEARAASERLDAQVHLAELPGAAGLFLVAA